MVWYNYKKRTVFKDVAFQPILGNRKKKIETKILEIKYFETKILIIKIYKKTN